MNSCFTGTPRTALTGASEQLFYRHKRTALHENDLHTNDLQTANSLLLDTVSTGCHEFVISQIITTTLTAKIGSAAKIALNRKRGDLFRGADDNSDNSTLSKIGRCERLSASIIGLYKISVSDIFSPPFTKLKGRNAGIRRSTTAERGIPIYSGVIIQFQRIINIIIDSHPEKSPRTAPLKSCFFLYIMDAIHANEQVEITFIRNPITPSSDIVIISKKDTIREISAAAAGPSDKPPRAIITSLGSYLRNSTTGIRPKATAIYASAQSIPIMATRRILDFSFFSSFIMFSFPVFNLKNSASGKYFKKVKKPVVRRFVGRPNHRRRRRKK